MKIMVAYDGTLQAKEALVYGLDKAREKGGEVIALHVFDSGMFVDYDASVDAEVIARNESARYVADAKALINEKGTGIRTSFFTTEGNPSDEVVRFAKERNVDMLLCPPNFSKIISKYRKAMFSHELAKETASRNLAALSAKTL